MTIIDLGTLVPAGFDLSGMYVLAAEDLYAGINIANEGQIFKFKTPPEVLDGESSLAIYYEYADHVVVFPDTQAASLSASTVYLAVVTDVAEKPDSIYETAEILYEDVIDIGELEEGPNENGITLYEVSDLQAGYDLAKVNQIFIFKMPADLITNNGVLGIYYDYADRIVIFPGINGTGISASNQYIAKVTAVAEKPDSIYESAVLL